MMAMIERPSIGEKIDSDHAKGSLTYRHGISSTERLWAHANVQEVARELKRLRVNTRYIGPGEFPEPRDFRPAIRAIDEAMCASREGAFVKSLNSVERFILIFMALKEWLKQSCRNCKGRKEVRPKDGPVIHCPTCHGSGKYRGTGSDRANAFGRALNRDEHRFMDLTRQEIDHADMTGDEDTKRRLFG